MWVGAVLTDLEAIEHFGRNAGLFVDLGRVDLFAEKLVDGLQERADGLARVLIERVCSPQDRVKGVAEERGVASTMSSPATV